jgi:hypothetical protein
MCDLNGKILLSH